MWIAAAWVLALTAAAFMWVLVTFWYLVVFGLFGVFVFPFRLMRRSQRRRERIAQQQLETMQSWSQRNPAS